MKKPYQSVQIVESNEPLADIPSDLFAVFEPHPYRILGADYGGRSAVGLAKAKNSSLLWQHLKFIP